MNPRTPIRALAAELAAGTLTARALLDACVGRIDDPSGEGARAFLTVDRAATAAADAIDAFRAAGGTPTPLAGLPIAVKDLFDVAGQTTTAGSVVLADRPAAVRDAPVVARVRAAGAVVVGRTNMTEFAYSGLGLNAHYDTPTSPWDRATGRIPGGSSSGSAVAVADGMAAVALGTDTGGSCRIPAAFCGITGYKPTASRIPRQGVVPLAQSLDSVGPLGPTVDCCAIIDDILAGGTGDVSQGAPPPDRLRLAVLGDLVTDDLDAEVAAAHEAALSALSAAGIELVEVPFPELLELPTINRAGGLAAAEAYAWHRSLLADDGDRYDQRIRVRIAAGAEIGAADYLDVLAARDRLIATAADRLVGFDAFVLPSVAIVPPPIGAFSDDDPAHYSRLNLLALRNTSVGNFLDTCAISMPATPEGAAPVGLMLMGRPNGDQELLAAARTVEAALGAVTA
ncbi:MAG: amidase [Actinomycetota bacterium]